MKVMLIRYHDQREINPRLPRSLSEVRGVVPPLGLAYIAAALEQDGHRVSILDALALNLTRADTAAAIARASPHIVGITTMTPTVRGALEAAALAKDHGATVILGGPQLAAYPLETVSHRAVDFGVVGEGEEVMRQLALRLQEGQPMQDIPGLVYKENGQVRANSPAIVPDVDALPWPAFHLLPMERYSSVLGVGRIATMISSRGCPFRCGFCFKHPSDRKLRWRSPKKVVDEMECLVSEYGVQEIMFYDDVFTVKRGHAWSICEEILSRNLRVAWETPTRVDRVDLELLRLMRRAGCVRIRYGIESGDNNILDVMKKRISLQEVRDAIRWTREAGIEAFGYFIIGYAGETPQSMARTIAFAKELGLDAAMFDVAVPYPHTDLYQQAQKLGIVSGDYWAEYTLGLREDKLPFFVPDAEQWVKKAYREFYFRPQIVVRRLRQTRSWEALRNGLKAAKALIFFKMAEPQEVGKSKPTQCR